MDLSVVELRALAAAGLAGDAIMTAIAGEVRAEPATWSPWPPPESATEVPGWLLTLRRT